MILLMYRSKMVFVLILVLAVLASACANENPVIDQNTILNTEENMTNETTVPVETMPGLDAYDGEVDLDDAAVNENNNNSKDSTTNAGKNEDPVGTTAPTTGENEGTAGTSAPTTGKNEGTEDTTPPTTAGKDESTEGTTAGTTGKDESPETTTPPSTDKEEEPDETTPPATDKEEEPVVTTPPTEVPTEPEEGDTVTAYEWYLSLSGPEQQAFFASFANPAEFFAWLNNAKAEYEALHPDVEIGDGNVDLGGGN